MNEPTPLTQPNLPAVLVAQRLLRLRRRIAPPGSLRERVLRRIYLPLVRRMQRREVIEQHEEAPPQPTVVMMSSLRARTAKWPVRPRILVLKLDHLGDFIVAMPALTNLRQAFPNAVITLVCASWNRIWADRCGLFDAVVTFDFFATTKAEWRGVTADHFARFAALGLGAFDLAIDLRHDTDTRPLLSHVETDVRAGFCAPLDLGGGALDIALPDMEHVSTTAGTGRPLHAETRLSLLIAAVTTTFAATTHPVCQIVGPPGRATDAAAGTESGGPPARPFAILAPGAGSPIRIWPIERLTAVGQALIARHDVDIVVVGAPAQAEACAAIAAALPAGRVRDLGGKVSIGDLPSVIAGALLMVGYDTGTSHLAASLGVPTVSVMGGVGDPDVWRIDGDKAVAIVSRMACSSCYLTYAAECPFDVTCFAAITVEHVLAACEAVLAPAAVQTRVLPTP